MSRWCDTSHRAVQHPDIRPAFLRPPPPQGDVMHQLLAGIVLVVPIRCGRVQDLTVVNQHHVARLPAVLVHQRASLGSGAVLHQLLELGP